VLYIDLNTNSSSVEAAVRSALGLDSLPVHPPYRSLLGLAYGAAVRSLSPEQAKQEQDGTEEPADVASVRRALRLLQRALLKVNQFNRFCVATQPSLT
jgi:hypothetical protein